MKLLPLTKGYFAKVDDEDYERLARSSWHVNIPSRNYIRAIGYVKRTGKYEKVYLHREIINAPNAIDVDHINGDPLDNRKSNLRLATTSQNRANSNLRKDNKSG